MTATADDVILVLGTGDLTDECVNDLYRSGYIYYPPIWSDDPVLWAAILWAQGGEDDIVLSWEPHATLPYQEQMAFVLQLTGGTIANPKVAGNTDITGAIAFDSVTMDGDGRVFTFMVASYPHTSVLATPSGYTSVDNGTASNPPNGSYRIAQKSVNAGAEAPGNSATISYPWATLTVGIHSLSSNITGVLRVDAVGGNARVAIPDGDELPGVPRQQPREAFPFPPEPKGIEIPGPPWLPDGQYRPEGS